MNTAYLYLVQSSCSTEYRFIKSNKAIKSPISQYDSTYCKICNWDVCSVFRMKDCPHSIKSIRNKRDVIRYAQFLLTAMNTISVGFGADVKKTCDILLTDYVSLVSLYPTVFDMPITDYCMKNICSKRYLLTTNKSNITYIIESAKKANANIEFLDGCDILFYRCKQHLPIQYGVFYRNSSLCIFSTKSKDWDKKYQIEYYRCVPFYLFKKDIKNNNRVVRIKKINGL